MSITDRHFSLSLLPVSTGKPALYSPAMIFTHSDKIVFRSTGDIQQVKDNYNQRYKKPHREHKTQFAL
jgi:hypothetical protein